MVKLAQTREVSLGLARLGSEYCCSTRRVWKSKRKYKYLSNDICDRFSLRPKWMWRGIDKLGTPPLLWSRLHCYHSGKRFMKGKSLLFWQTPFSGNISDPMTQFIGLLGGSNCPNKGKNACADMIYSSFKMRSLNCGPFHNSMYLIPRFPKHHWTSEGTLDENVRQYWFEIMSFFIIIRLHIIAVFDFRALYCNR